MQDKTIDIISILAQLRQEFIESVGDQLDDIESKIDRVEDKQCNPEEELLSVRRHIHNIKGQGATFGFPLTGRVAHMLEDYLENANGILAEDIPDIRAYLSLMADLVSTGESIAGDDPHSLLSALPTGQVATFSAQRAHTINVLLVMPPGLQRKLVAKELLSCGFRIMRAYNSLVALSIAADLRPDIVFVNYDIGPFNGRELASMFGAVETLRDIHFVLLTSYDANSKELENLPDNISVIQKQKNFTEGIGELMIQWGIFGNIPQRPTAVEKTISKHPKTANIVRIMTKRPLKILAAEDNPVNQRLIKATIEGFGHQLEIVENGLQAVQAIIGGDFDLVFMDVLMPEMGGADAARTIRHLPGGKSSIPIIAVTSAATAEHRAQYSALGINECVGKPIERAELLAAINKAMGEEIHVEAETDEQHDAAEEADQTIEKPANGRRTN